ncbi:MAG: L-histidine N(alpha)-methyltransferase [Anaerolineae bacterium]|nr:L-histidine N(alpha)-methyltransferase [Anaerolineae bacterium]
MDPIIVISPEADLEHDYLVEDRQTKKIRQNFFYMTEGAPAFYAYRDEDFREIRWQDECAFFEHQPFWRKGVPLAFISLGCGNAGSEKAWLSCAHAGGYDVAYFGVDSSRAMLTLAQENLAQETFERAFLLADFSTEVFQERLREMTGTFAKRVYAMLGGTFGNFEQSEIVETLAALIAPGDYLYLDVVPRYTSESQDRQLRERLSRLPQNLQLFFDSVLRRLGLDQELGEVYGDEVWDEPLQAWRYRFFFRAREAVTLPGAESVSLSPGEPLELLNIRAYNPDALKAYMDAHGFAFVDAYVPDVGHLAHLWQRFLFCRR